jgi:hypothetical protein
MTDAHEKPELPMSVPLAIPLEPVASHFLEVARRPLPLEAAVAKARWIAESDPRVSIVVGKRSISVSTFVSRPHSNSGGWTLGVRYMAATRGGPELIASAVVDLFNCELLSVVTFDSITEAAGF